MDSRKKRIVRMTSIFVALETVFVYYASGIFILSSSPRLMFEYLPGYGYIIRTFFYYFWYGVYYPPVPGRRPTISPLLAREFLGVEHFTVALFYGLIVVAIIVAIIYAIKLKVTLRAVPKLPSPSL